jgi:GTP 3',8-cyclase
VSSKSAFVPAHSLVRRGTRHEGGPLAHVVHEDQPFDTRANVHSTGDLAREGLRDERGRLLRDLRLSVTDRCNLRCTYCMPKEVFGAGYQFLPKQELLTFEELTAVARAFVELGVRKIRLTGGEPLLRAQLPTLVSMLSALGVELALTTNGVLLSKHAQALAQAGLHRVTVSLDALSDENLRIMSGKPDASAAVILRAIEDARSAGLGVKVNTVVRRGVNEKEVLPLVSWFRGRGVAVRFIEYMDVGHTNHWQYGEVVPTAELVAKIDEQFPLRPVTATNASDVARRYVHADGHSEVGFIASVTEPFCGDCTRARVSAKGELYTCLFAGSGVDLRGPLRNLGAGAAKGIIVSSWRRRGDRYSEVRGTLTQRLDPQPEPRSNRVEMSYIGG